MAQTFTPLAETMDRPPTIALDVEFIEPGHIYRLDGERVPSVTNVVNIASPMDWSRVNPDDLAAAQKRGTDVHLLVQLYLENDLHWPSVAEAYRPFLDAYCEFEALTGFRPDAIEQARGHRVYRFAGRADLRGPMNGGRAVVDVKSGGLGAVELQTAGYALLDEGHVRRFSLRLRDNGKPKVDEYGDAMDRRVYLNALGIAHYRMRKGGNP